MDNQLQTQAEDIFKIKEIIAKYSRFLLTWGIASVVFFVGMAFILAKTKPPSYLRTASVMIKETNSSSRANESGISEQLAVSMNSSVKNEVEAFQSYKLVQDVVSEMNLTISYSQKKGLKMVTLYDFIPVVASFPGSSDDESFSFQVLLGPDNSINLSKFEYQKNKIDQIITGKLNDTIDTPIGKVAISPTQHYKEYGKGIPLKVHKSSINSETRSYVKKLKASRASKESAIIVLTITDTYIPRAEKFLITLISSYNKLWLEDKNKSANSLQEFFDEKLPEIQAELKTIEDEIDRYKTANRLTDVKTSGLMNMSQSSDIIVQVMEVNNQISMARFIKDHLDNNNNIHTLMPSVISNTTIESQMVQYNALLSERDALLANSSDRNPQVIERNNRLTAMRGAIVLYVNNHIEGLNVRLSSLKRQEAQMNQQIASNPIQERHLLTLERERQTKEDLYMMFLKKKEENEMSIVMNSENTRIISPPSGSNSPVAPKKMLMMLVALVLGVGVPGSYIWGKENLNTVILGKDDLEKISVPFLGVISLANGEDQKNGKYLRVTETGVDMINETFRMVRTSLDSTCGKDKKIIMFTSFEPGCGKTFIALNLAMSFALAGKKVALVDTDMRTATLSKITDDEDDKRNPNKFGICHFLSEKATLKQLYEFCFRKDRYFKHFDIYPIGEIPPNPAELLMSNNFSRMLDSLKKKYDYVFMDCTPLDIVTDAEIVSKHADFSVFIVREDFTDRRSLQKIDKIYKLGQINKKILLEKRGNIEKQRRIEDKKINDDELKLLDVYERDKRRIIEDQNAIKDQNKLDELKAELEDLDKLRKSEKNRIKEERKKLIEQRKLDDNRLSEERIPFDEIALILNGHKKDIFYNKHHKGYQKKIDEVKTNQLRGTHRMKELPKSDTKSIAQDSQDINTDLKLLEEKNLIS